MNKTQHKVISFHAVILFVMITLISLPSFGQCPTVSNPNQSFCDLDSPIIADLVATNNGNGIRWFATATSTTPLSPSDGLINGEDYYADRPSGNCGIRSRVDVTIYGPPFGLNFQGVCVDDPNDATISDLVAFGNNVQWFNVPVGGTPLPGTTVLVDNTIYYASQENPDTGCLTSRLSVLVNTGIVPVPVGDAIQTFCSSDTPTVADLVASGNNNWYSTMSSAVPLDPTTPLVGGENYFSTTIDPPCESSERFEVTVVFEEPSNTGISGNIDICESDINSIGTIDLIDGLTNNPEPDGTWTGPFPTSNGSTGTVDITNMTVSGSPYVFTYTLDPDNSCQISSSTVTIEIIEPLNPGTDASIDICDNDTNTIDLFTVLGGTPDSGGTWSPALNSGTGVFDPNVDAEGTYTYTVVGTPPCGDASASVTVAIVPQPNAGTNASIDICDNDTNTIDLFTVLGGTPDSGGTWSPDLNSGTGVFDPNIDAPGTYTYTVVGTPPCGDASASVTVAIVPEPNAGTDASIDICGNDTNTIDLFTILGGTPDSGGTWSPALNSGTGVFDPNIDAPGTYTYTVVGTPPCGDASASVTVAIVPEPNAGTDASIDICGNDTNTIDLFTILGGTPDSGGTWSPALNSGTGVFDPNTDAPGTYTYTVVGTPPCGDASASVTVAIVPEPNAGTDASIDICGNDTNTIDLFTILGGTPDSGGTWSPALNSGTGVFDPNTDAPGTYTYTVVGTPPCGDASASVTVAIVPEPNAGTDASIDICGNDTNTIDLFTILGGTPDSGGTWSPTLNSGTGVFDPNIDAPGTYTYTVVGTPPCGDASASVTVAIVPEPNAGTDASIDICGNDTNTIDLFTILGGTPDSGGTWSPDLNSGTGVFDPNIDAPGTYTYTVVGTPPCGDASASVTVAIVPEPNAGTDASIDICGNDTNTIDLFTILGGTPDSGGTWSPDLNSGTGVFDPNIDAPGTYTYTVVGTPPCGDASASVTVAIVPEPNAGTDASIDICGNDTNTIDLFTILGGTPDSGGTWSPALNSGTGVFDPNTDAPGTYTYTVVGTPPCGDASASVTVAIVPEPNAGTDASIDICGNDTNTIDLFTILGGTPDSGGTWSPTLNSGTGVFDPNTDAPGTYTYTVVGTPPCGDASASVTVAIVPEPNAGTDASIDICGNDTNTIDLFTILGGTPDSGGTWSPALNSGTGVFDPNIDAPGTYTYTVVGTPPCGDASASVTVAIVPEPNAGTDASIDICGNDTNTIDLFTILGGTPDSGGTWSPDLNSGTGVFDPNIDAPGTYTYTVVGTPPCGDASASVTVAIVPEPNAGTDASIDICGNDTNTIDLFTILGGTPDSGGTWSPDLNSGTGVFDPNIDAPGTYTYTVVGTPPCGDASASVTVAIVPEPNAGTDASIDICGNDTNTIDLFTILGGTPDSGGTWSPDLNSGTGVFDPNIDAPGTYTYTVVGTPPCGDASASVTVAIVPEPNAGIDSTATICSSEEDVNLFDFIEGSPDPGGTWSPPLFSGTNIFDPDLDSPGDYTYTVNGSSSCEQSASSILTVVVESGPEAFGLTFSADDVCLGFSNLVTVSGASLLPDGQYVLTYSLTGANESQESVTLEFSNGNSSFSIPADILLNVGTTTLSIVNLTGINANCSAVLIKIFPVNFEVLDSITPSLIDEGNVFCIQDEPTIADLTNNISGSDPIIWYDAATNGTAYSETTPLIDGTTYYASALSTNNCESSTRLEVTVVLEDCFEDIVIPDGFSPNEDGINDDFNIVNLRELYPLFTLEIYNRYGNLLYKGNSNTPNWDGVSNKGITLGNGVVPTGVYFYILKFNDGNRSPIQGRVYLSR